MSEGHEQAGRVDQGGSQRSRGFLYLGKARGLMPLTIALEMNIWPRMSQQKRIIQIWGDGCASLRTQV